jgi:hypothetical protein
MQYAETLLQLSRLPIGSHSRGCVYVMAKRVTAFIVLCRSIKELLGSLVQESKLKAHSLQLFAEECKERCLEPLQNLHESQGRSRRSVIAFHSAEDLQLTNSCVDTGHHEKGGRKKAESLAFQANRQRISASSIPNLFIP